MKYEIKLDNPKSLFQNLFLVKVAKILLHALSLRVNIVLRLVWLLGHYDLLNLQLIHELSLR